MLKNVVQEPAKMATPAKTNISSTREEPANEFNLTYREKSKSKMLEEPRVRVYEEERSHTAPVTVARPSVFE